MELRLCLGGLIFYIQSERPLILDPEYVPFLRTEGKADIEVRISWDWRTARYPSGPKLGEDLLQEYYQEDTIGICLVKGGRKGYIAAVYYNGDFRHMKCTINEAPFRQPPKSLGQIMRFLPIRAAFLHFGLLFFHAAQIEMQGIGILFTAPSGTGKTTQAELWQKYERARLICNDRTLARCIHGKWTTYGYPIDGSKPVGSGEILPLGAVVLLGQAEKDKAERIRGIKSAAKLLPQLVIDGWNGKEREQAVSLLLQLQQDIPTYRFDCTNSRNAVACLKDRLRKDGIIEG